MLPGMDGEAVLEKIREQGVMPVIIISAKNEKETKVSTLRSGADDFITKPFDIDEVSARIDSLLRRYRYTNEATERVLTHKDSQLNLEEKTVYVNVTKISITLRGDHNLKRFMF